VLARIAKNFCTVLATTVQTQIERVVKRNPDPSQGSGRLGNPWAPGFFSSLPVTLLLDGLTLADRSVQRRFIPTEVEC